MALLEIHDLSLEFAIPAGSRRVVDRLSLSVAAGETLALVGESGSGKTVTALAIARLLPEPATRFTTGRILLAGRDVLGLSQPELRRLRGGTVSYVFQEPGAALNPVQRVGTQILEALRLHRPEAATRTEILRLLRQVGIPAPETRSESYPHQLSGGLQQRVMIAMALACQPKLLVADEPTTALDVTIQAQIMDLLRELRDQLGMSLLLISHHLGLVGDIADRVAVMYAGQIVELAPVRKLLASPLHPYTQALLRATPQLGNTLARLDAIPGSVPLPGTWPSGCRFHPRCRHAQPSCASMAPTLAEFAPGSFARCPFAHELATVSTT